jgi:hypothetical protein
MHNLAGQIGEISSDHQHFAVRHIDDVHQAKAEGETQGDEQQDRPYAKAVEYLTCNDCTMPHVDSCSGIAIKDKVTL